MLSTLQELLLRTFMGNTLWNWLVSLLVVIIAQVALYFLRGTVVSRLRKSAKKTDSPFDDVIADVLARTNGLVFLLLSLFAGTQFIVLPSEVEVFFRTAAIIAALIQIGIWGTELLRFAIRGWVQRRTPEEQEMDKTTVSALNLLMQLVVWSIVVILALDNLPGVEVNSLIAGLGITGIAVALAVQNVLGELIAWLAIVLDRPFVIGDFIVVGDMLGTVEKIGIRTTRVRSLQGEELILSNNNLLDSSIQNFKTMEERRVVFQVGVTYDTPAGKLEAIPGMIERLIEPVEGARFDRAHFSGFGDSALLFEVVYYVDTGDYVLYMDIQQEIYLNLLKQFNAEAIEFAFPTRTVILQQE